MASCLVDQAYSELYYDAWEVEPLSSREGLLKQRLDEYIRYAAERVPFYGERLSAYDPKAKYPLQEVPFLTSSQLRELVPPVSRKLVATEKDNFTVFQSGGTTGLPKTTPFSHEELEQLNLPNARGYYAIGLRKEDRVANLFATGSLYMTFLHINRMLQQYGCTNYPLSNHTPVEFIHTVAKAFGVNCFTGVTSAVLTALRGMYRIGWEGIRVDKVYYSAEHLYEADKKELQEKYGVKEVATLGYGTVDSWYLGYQCKQCPLGVFHTHDDQVYLEIINEETNTPCDKEQAGMLYATAFPRKVMPIIRYQIGDRAKWLGEKCNCGRTTPLFHLLGRGDDVLRIGFDSIDYNFIQQTISELPELSGTAQMQKVRESGRDRLVLRVETESDPALHAQLSQRLTDLILSYRPSLRGFIEKETVWPLEVKLLELGSIPRNPKTGKLIRVIDAI